jgi:predicted O-linked N-acetylglucosamine transferase (SPINDLY family)
MLNSEQTALEGVLLARAGKMNDAEAKFRQLVQQDPQTTSLILLASLLPPVYQSMDDLHQWRNRLEGQLRQIVDAGLKQDLEQSFAVPDLLAHYMGLNDRPLQELRAKLYTAPQNQDWVRKREPSADGKIRVGLISKYFKDHPIGRMNLGLVAKLPKQDFHITVLSAGESNDDIGDQYRRHADKYITLPEQISALPEIRRMIAGLNLDVLYYPDVGLEPMTYTLAQSRLAPVQCVGWNNPVTSGLPTMDYFISAEGLEPDDQAASQSQYTEKVVRLKDMAAYFERPAADASPGGRDRLGLPLDAHLYVCPHALYKMHPEFDDMLAGILRGDPRGVLVLMEGPYKEWKQWLLERFSRTTGDAVRRVRFVANQDRQGLLRLIRVCDVLLDPLHYSGDRTTFEALFFGTPVATLPTNMLRGRFAYKMYKSMSYQDCVAKDKADYVRIALELGMNKPKREQARHTILAGRDALCENDAGIQQLGEFWKSVVKGAS